MNLATMQAQAAAAARTLGGIVREDPLKAAGLAALAYVGLRLLIGVLRVMWRFRWLVVALVAVAAVVYVTRKDDVTALAERIRRLRPTRGPGNSD